MPVFPLLPLAGAALGGAVLTESIGQKIKKAGQRKEIERIVQDSLKDRLGDPTGGFNYQTGYGPGMTKIAEEKLKSAEDMLENMKQVRYDYDLSPAAQKFQKLGSLKEPALLLGGTLAALGTAAVAKKLFQKAEQRRIKKEDPLQYKKYKRGDYTKED